MRARVIGNAAHIGELSRQGRVATGVACASLVDGRCSAYEVRPLACAGYHSLSREKCEESYDNAGESPAGVPLLEALRHVPASLDDGTKQALAATGLSAVRVELHAAVAALMRNPALIERWRSGRDPGLKATRAGV